MLAIQTDMKLPEDVDQVQLQVSVYGNLLFGNTYPVGAGQLLIPATFALVAGKDPSTPVTVRLIARRNGRPRMLREVVTTVPTDRTAMLRLPVQWLCDGTAKQTGESVESTCPNGQSCVAGSCVENTVESAKLPPFEPQAVFGGGTQPWNGLCFNTVACFGQGHTVPVTLEGCTIDRPAGDFSVALVKPPGSEGICGSSGCYVPVDADEETGWREQVGRVVLPKAVCERLASGEVNSVAVTAACGTKTPAMPTCGAWSAVKTDPGATDVETTDAGSPAEAGLEDASARADADVPAAATDGGVDDVSCGAGTIDCSGKCVDAESDPNNCGGCGRQCDGICQKGVCSRGGFGGGPICAPRTCEEVGSNCGMMADGCGGVLDCGTCAGGQQCGGGGIPGRCGDLGGDPAMCGDGVVNGGEECDDGDTQPADGCNGACQIEPGYTCPTPGEECVFNVAMLCGNGQIEGTEACDDDNTSDGDGCSAGCEVEPGWACTMAGQPCTPAVAPRCGDGVVNGGEQCDDGNMESGDGCSGACKVEPGYDCPTPGSACVRTIPPDAGSDG